MGVIEADILAELVAESREHLAQLEPDLLGMEADPELATDAVISRVFRAVHSIKGGFAFFGLNNIKNLSHGMENVFARIRDGALRPTPRVMEALLAGLDGLHRLLDDAENSESHSIERELRALESARTSDELPGPPGPRRGASALPPHVFLITVGLQADIYDRGLTPLSFVDRLARAGEVCGVELDLSGITGLDGCLQRDILYSLVYFTPLKRVEVAALAGVLVEQVVKTLDADGTTPAPEESGAPAPAGVDSPASVAPAAPGEPGARHVGGESDSIRVSIDKVDALINLVGELVITQSMISMAVTEGDGAHPDAMMSAITQLERHTREIQERVMAVRMVPVKTVFSRYPRVVRDLAARLGKPARLEMSGEETELDKSVVERISDPLIHLIRNAVDHGIEEPEKRAANGKGPEGVVRLSAYTQGGNVYIEVADDGNGLDAEKLRLKAVDRGLITADQVLTEEQCHNLVFLPGFSTAEQVSDVSGRGVGMDVVKRNVESLNGTVSIVSQRGQGTCFRISLPLTLAILEGLLTRVCGEMYILPLASVIESLRITDSDVTTLPGRGDVIVVRGEVMPLVRLQRVLGLPEPAPVAAEYLATIVETGGRRAALLADELLGQRQVVIKSLETHFRRVEGLMGATILGDGRIALILDIPGLVRLAGRTGTDSLPSADAAASPAPEPGGPTAALPQRSH